MIILTKMEFLNIYSIVYLFFIILLTQNTGSQLSPSNEFENSPSSFMSKSSSHSSHSSGSSSPFDSSHSSGISSTPEDLDIHTAGKEEFPYHVSIQYRIDDYKYEHRCSGAIISKWFVLTASDCIIDTNESNWKIQFGTLDTNYKVENSMEIGRISNYEDYKGEILNDLSVLTCITELTFYSETASVEIIDYFPAMTTYCISTGWGYIHGDKYNPQVLKRHDTEISEKCSETGKYHDKRIICTYKEFQKDCKGDPGSPLVCNDKLTGIGIIGPSDDCKNLRLFTNLYPYSQWIEEVTGLTVIRKESGCHTTSSKVRPLIFVLVVFVYGYLIIL